MWIIDPAGPRNRDRRRRFRHFSGPPGGYRRGPEIVLRSAIMAQLVITFWRDIPSMVEARRGRKDRAKRMLPDRFQEAIDGAAMRAGARLLGAGLTRAGLVGAG